MTVAIACCRESPTIDPSLSLSLSATPHAVTALAAAVAARFR